MASLNDASAGLVQALRHAGLTEVDASARRRAEYSTDASLYRVLPTVVAFPRHADELEATVDVCRMLGVPLTTRGAGTSIAGNAVGTGVVVDCSRHLNKVHAIDPEAGTANVDPGVVLDDLQRLAAQHGLRFGPDPSSHSRCTLGGMIGNNACGSRALGYGRTADNVLAADIVTGTGERLHVSAGGDAASSPTLADLDALVRSRLEVIRTELGRFSRQVSGYSLEHLLPERRFDVAKALVGSEGTLAVLQRAVVRLVRAPEVTTLVVLGYSDMAEAADAVPALLPFGLSALEGLDARIINVVRARRGSVPELPRGQGWLFAEIPSDDPTQIHSVITQSGALGVRVVQNPREAATLWQIREDGAGLAARVYGDRPGHAGWEDAAVPPQHLGAYLREFEALLLERDLRGVPYGHFGDGCVHIRIDFPLEEPCGRQTFRDFLVDAAKLAARYGGSMSGEHGDGRARGELLQYMYSQRALDTFAAVKDIFDPQDVLNPGVIVRPRPADRDLRQVTVLPLRTNLAFVYQHDRGDFSTAVHRCTGVGKCRVTAKGGVMCPSFRATRDERDSTRGRSRVLQELANANSPLNWRSPEVHDALDLCLACKACSSDCPTGVDMATYKAEVLHQRYRHRPRPAAHYALGWLPRWARIASMAPKAINAAMSGSMASAGKRLAGVDPRRSLPPFAPQTFRKWFASHGASQGKPVMLWVDTFTDHFTPQVGIAAVGVLEDAGFAVSIPDRKLCCGLTWISTGQLDAARRILGRSVRALANVDTPIVGLEPSCTAVFRGDAKELLGPTEDVVTVSQSVTTLAELLSDVQGWTPPDLTGRDAVVQPHCHHHAVMGFDADRALLEKAGANVQVLGGCCGLAGNFGAERGHYDVSVAVAENELLPALRSVSEDTVILADGFSCRTQINQLTDQASLHLAQLLARREPQICGNPQFLQRCSEGTDI